MELPDSQPEGTPVPKDQSGFTSYGSPLGLTNHSGLPGTPGEPGKASPTPAGLPTDPEAAADNAGVEAANPVSAIAATLMDTAVRLKAMEDTLERIEKALSPSETKMVTPPPTEF